MIMYWSSHLAVHILSFWVKQIYIVACLQKDQYEYWSSHFFHVYSTYYILELYGLRNLSNLLHLRTRALLFLQKNILLRATETIMKEPQFKPNNPTTCILWKTVSSKCEVPHKLSCVLCNGKSYTVLLNLCCMIEITVPSTCIHQPTTYNTLLKFPRCTYPWQSWW
jgi:hypothetical protein